MFLINCGPFHSFSFPFICYFFEAADQTCSPELCENTCIGVVHKKTEVASIRETTSSKFLSCKICEIFQNSFFLEQLPANVSALGVCPVEAGIHIFLEYFQFLQGITLQCICKCLLLIIWYFPRVVDKWTDKWYIEWQQMTMSDAKNGN